MIPVPWMKQQDFCLRLGVLRALLAFLPAHDRSVDRGPVLRRLNALFFAPLSTKPALEARTRVVLGGKLEKPTISKTLNKHYNGLTVADGLLLTSNNPSWGQPLDEKHSAKILEWGQSSGFVGRGNQITERGKLLRGFFDPDALKKFAAGDVDAWNPFEIPPIERLYLLYHLGERDEVLWRIAVAGGIAGDGALIDTARAHVLTAEAMRHLVNRVEKSAPMSEYAKLRPLRELTRVIEWEALGIPLPTGHQVGPMKAKRTPERDARQTKKNADHQAIPRCEMLVDMGVFTKTIEPGLVGPAQWKAHKAWTFRVTPAGAAFAKSVAELTGSSGPVAPWHWKGFATAAAAGGFVGNARAVPMVEVVDRLFDCYARIARPVGHTPLESVALLTSHEALRFGQVVEVEAIHALFLRLKSTGAIQQHLFFAGRNELDRMFIVMKPTGREPLRAWLTSESNAA